MTQGRKDIKKMRSEVVKAFCCNNNYARWMYDGIVSVEILPVVRELYTKNMINQAEKFLIPHYTFFESMTMNKAIDGLARNFYPTSRGDNLWSPQDVVDTSMSSLITLKRYIIQRLGEEQKWGNLDSCIKNIAPQYNLECLSMHSQDYLASHLKKLEMQSGFPRIAKAINNILNEALVINEHYKRTPLKDFGLDGFAYNVLKEDFGIKTAEDITKFSSEESYLHSDH